MSDDGSGPLVSADLEPGAFGSGLNSTALGSEALLSVRLESDGLPSAGLASPDLSLGRTTGGELSGRVGPDAGRGGG